MSSEKKLVEEIREISGVNPLKCMKCGKCSATCPSYNEMDIKPQMCIRDSDCRRHGSSNKSCCRTCKNICK